MPAFARCAVCYTKGLSGASIAVIVIISSFTVFFFANKFLRKFLEKNVKLYVFEEILPFEKVKKALPGAEGLWGKSSTVQTFTKSRFSSWMGKGFKKHIKMTDFDVKNREKSMRKRT